MCNQGITNAMRCQALREINHRIWHRRSPVGAMAEDALWESIVAYCG